MSRQRQPPKCRGTQSPREEISVVWTESEQVLRGSCLIEITSEHLGKMCALNLSNDSGETVSWNTREFSGLKNYC